MKDEAGERDREVSSLNSKLLSLQVDIKNLHDVCKRQRKTLQDNQLCMEEAMNSSHNKKQAQALAFEESEMEFGSSKQCHLRQLQQLKKKLLALQQELEFRTEELQTSYCSLRQYQSILEKQTSDLVLLHHHCKLKEDEVILYEEEMGNHNENTGEKLHLAQEQLALAGDKIASLERSLSLYRDKYQSSLSNIELLEYQVKMLQGELGGIMGQEPENKGDHSKVRIYTSPCMIQEHQETLKRLSEVWQKVSEQDDLIQELRNKLACSNALVLEREEALIKLQADFASYTATHRYPPSSSEECEDIKKILKHLQEQKDSQCLHVEEYQNLVKDLRMELEVVSEQKKNIMKDVMKLELDLHRLREETSAHIERKDKDIAILQCRLQELQLEFTETQKLALKKDKFLQEKDEMLHELQKKLTQVQNSFLKKEKELEKQQCMATELEMTVKEAKQDKSKKVECEALQAEVQKLKNSLEEAKQQQRLAAQQAAQCKEEAVLAGCHLEDTQRKLQNGLLLDKQKADTIQELQRELQKLQKESSMAEREQSCNRKRVEELSSELSEALRKLENSDKEKRQLQKTVAEQDMKMNDMLDRIKLIQHQHREQESTKCKLEDDLQEATKLLEDKREQLKKSKDREKLMEEELEALRQEFKKKDKTREQLKENSRKLEEENENLRAELQCCSTQLESSVNKYNTSQQVIQDLNKEIALQKESLMSLQAQLDKALQKEKHYLQTTITKEAYDALSRKSAACQDDLTQALEKLNHVTSETKSLQRSLTQTQERKAQLEEEIIAYEERMKKLNMELKKLQGFHQESELEVHAFDKKLEEMSCQVLQWQKQHQNDLKMLAAKEEQLREFQEEMAALKENLLEDDKEPCCLPQRSVPKDTCRLYRENDQIMTSLEQWAKQQKVANEKLGNKLREQVKYIAKLSGEKDHLHNVMVHLQQENKKLKKEIEDKKTKAENTRLCTKALGPSKMESTQRGKVCGALGWKGLPQDVGQRMDLTKYIGMPHCLGSSYC
ncbi:PREDICTED: polyamine-modulated factor 1-binding protein 1 isoform X1 [Rhinopithecus bieti]|uniref:polyamine-modulated factor 1-binding protein 1 isoform X1 n=1 Tax=Rhinopithecus bieti TaxID=61621 RepID=UPI00083BD16F|nr:PREDICTED: polyamine-modulated factor 1-binding protein 1 isoform X1 [Rhinopithecus bieti]XP_017726805.1 PREDICTED: polyamine-modulated factor 1-binding protein 1 isoform X1 [Rhinopithecus bieti]XP_017726806.1 PREDICTED: polyamine-modulated factor 1-binding protein 1 isoform X1 [Rhinopithecus bieti]XP_017726807.1 PREDICTED: polyamine-modulated factor 1-binding protein 1 isoform X1 [Rhinopithecus bieti]